VLSLQQLVTTNLTAKPGGRELAAMSAAIARPNSKQADYQQGYALAEAVRERLANIDQPLDVEAMLSALGIAVRDVDLSDPTLDGGAVWTSGNEPVVFVNNKSDRASSSVGRRMVLAHELCHLIVDKRAAVPLATMSGEWAPPRMERRANAFAAELLLPLKGIMRVLGRRRFDPSDDDISVLMAEFPVGMTTTARHLDNRGCLVNVHG